MRGSMAGLSISEAYPWKHSQQRQPWDSARDRGDIVHLEYAEQLLHVGPLGFQQLVHDVSAEREGRRSQAQR